MQSFARISCVSTILETPIQPCCKIIPLQMRQYSQTSILSEKAVSGRSQRINPPTSTLPAPLDLPTRKPDQSLPGFLFSTGKAYLNFYKTGAKNIYANRNTTKALKAKLDPKYRSSIQAAIKDRIIDRHDFQLFHRTNFDLKRIPIFGIVFIICGEFTPLVVLAVPAVVPFTCRIPRQITGYRKTMEERRKISFRNLTTPLSVEAKIFSAESNGPDNAPARISDSLERMQLIHISWSLGLSSSLWDWLGGQLPGLPTGILRRKVKKRVEYLDMDDELMTRAGRVEELSKEEVEIAAVERSIDVLGRNQNGIKADLQKWLESRKAGTSAERLLLSRPNVWPGQSS